MLDSLLRNLSPGPPWSASCYGVWNHPLHTPYISSLNQGLLFAAHAHTIATCFAVVLRLSHIFPVYVSTLYIIQLHTTHTTI